MIKSISGSLPMIALLVLILLLSLSRHSFAEEEKMDQYFREVVLVRGELTSDDEGWTIQDRIFVAPEKHTLKPGSAQIIGILWPPGKKYKGLPHLEVLDYSPGTQKNFSIEKYEGTLKFRGKRPDIIHQHPIDTTVSTYVDYFDCSMGQLVVYFKTEKDAEKFRSGRDFILEGKLFPIYTYSKRPPSEGETPQKFFYGHQLKVERVIVPQD